MTQAQRKRVLELVAGQRHSYAVIAKLCGVTRNAVAGAVFRARHPKDDLVRHGSGRQKSGALTGLGWRQRSYFPEVTAIHAEAS